MFRHRRKLADWMAIGIVWLLSVSCESCAVGGCFQLAPAQAAPDATYRRFQVFAAPAGGLRFEIQRDSHLPRWAEDVNRTAWQWAQPQRQPFFLAPIAFVIPPAADSGEPFHRHNHQPSITWLANGDLMAIWYSTELEHGSELTVLASRLRGGQSAWDEASEFFKAPRRNMHGSSIFYDGQDTLYHFNGMAREDQTGWDELALLMRTSRDHGVTWSTPRAIDPHYGTRHQVIADSLRTSTGKLIVACDASPRGDGGTALFISDDGGQTWHDPGSEQPSPQFTADASGVGTIAGIHAKVVELTDGRWLALGRGDAIDGQMPQSISMDQGKTWRYAASPFPPIGSGQRLVLMRLREGPLMLVSFARPNRTGDQSPPLEFSGAGGTRFVGQGMFAALSFDEGASWPIRKLLTPGPGKWNGGAWTAEFESSNTRAEPAGYLAATQTPDHTIHLISSRLHYRFNYAWLVQHTEYADKDAKGRGK